MSVDEHGDFEPTDAEVRWLHGTPDPEPDSWAPRNLAELEDKPPVQPTLGGLGLVYPGKRHVFSGPQESAKTLAAYAVALCVIREGGAVVLIDFEMGPWDAKRRLVELGATPDELGALHYLAPDTRADETKVAALVELAPSLVLVDAAAGAFDLQELDDNKRGDVERFARLYTNVFWKAGIATIVLDHVTKNAESRGNYAIGSERKVGQADVHLGFSVITPIKRGGHGLYQVTTHKDRGGFHRRGKLATFDIASDPETHHFTWAFVPAAEVDEEHPFRPTGLMESVSRYLERIMEPVPRGQIEADITGKRDYVRLALDVLTSEGFLSESEGARGARLYLSARPFREASDLAPDLAPTSPPTPRNRTSPLAPPPYGEGGGGDLAPRAESTSPRGLFGDDEEPAF